MFDTLSDQCPSQTMAQKNCVTNVNFALKKYANQNKVNKYYNFWVGGFFII